MEPEIFQMNPNFLKYLKQIERAVESYQRLITSYKHKYIDENAKYRVGDTVRAIENSKSLRFVRKYSR